MDSLNILGIPFDFGQDHIGVRLACEYLKDNGLLSRLSKYATINDFGELPIPFKHAATQDQKIKYKLNCSEENFLISEQIRLMSLDSSFLLNVGGDHGLGLGSVHGMLMQNEDTIVVWADAHGDINTPETSPSGNFHGMPLSFLLGIAHDDDFSWVKRKLSSKQLIYFGPRDLDPAEKEIIEQFQIQYFSSEEVNRIGSKEIIEMALNRVDPFSIRPIHLSLDVDLFDSFDVKATGTRVPLGPRQDEVFLMGGMLAQTGRLRSMDLVEFNPLIGSESEVADTCELVLRFLESTIGEVFSWPRIRYNKIYEKSLYL